MNAFVERVPTDPMSGDASTAHTIRLMSGVIREQVYSPRVIACVNTALLGVKVNASDKDVARAIYRWIKSHVRYVTDPEINNELWGNSVNANDVELLISPEVLVSMQSPKGDCDCFSMLGATMCLIAGLQVRIKTIAADSRYPSEWTHVYLEVLCGGQWVPFDASHGSVLGWEYPHATRVGYWNI